MSKIFKNTKPNIEIHSSKEKIQEDEFWFPYHFIPQYIDGKFSQAQNIGWGYKYLSKLEQIISILKKNEFHSLLDVGCGDGRLLYELVKEIPNCHFVGLDYSETPLRFARAFTPEVEFICDDIKKSGVIHKESFDIVTLIEVLEHIPLDQIDEFISGIAYVIKKNGKLIITVPSTNFPLLQKHYQHFDLTKLQYFIRNHFNIEQVEYLNNRFNKLINWSLAIFENKYFIPTYPRLITSLYNFYKRHYLICNFDNCETILLICSKANPGDVKL